MASNVEKDPISGGEELNKPLKKFLLVLNCGLLAIGNCAAPLISRLYFLKGGNKVWLSSALETAGWPFVLFPLFVSYIYRRGKEGPHTKLVHISPRLFLASAVLGLLTGVDDFLYAFGVSRLPTSTSALIIATQLAFTAFFAFILVRQNFSSYTINSIVLLSIGALILALHTSSDRPNHESKKAYFAGFFMVLGASALYGFVLPAIELTYKKAKQNVTYTLVMEMQMVMSFFATAFCVSGMFFHKDFQAIPREADSFELGKTIYYVVLACSAFLWQCFFMGAVGVVFCGSSLFSGIMIAVLLPVTETLAVLFYHESFKVEKGLSLILSLWGSISYFYGEYIENKKRKRRALELELP